MTVGRVVVVGLGLIGGSIAQGLKRAGATVIGFDVRPLEAQYSDWVSEFGGTDHRQLAAAAAEADLVVLALPVSGIESTLRHVHRAAAVTDCGSTKRSIMSAAAQSPVALHFVGGHPMAGHPIGGRRHASPDLFRDRRWVVCEGLAEARAVARVRGALEALGAVPVALSPQAHDEAMAWVSHVPHILANALDARAHRHSAVAGPSYASSTRVAGGPPAVWRDIFAANADQLATALRTLSDDMEKIADGLEAGDTELLEGLLVEARKRRG